MKITRKRKEPRLLVQVLQALADLKETRGSTLRRVTDQVQTAINLAKARPKPKNVLGQVRRALKHGVQTGVLRHRAGKFRLATATEINHAIKLGCMPTKARRRRKCMKQPRRRRARTRQRRRRRFTSPTKRRRRRPREVIDTLCQDRIMDQIEKFKNYDSPNKGYVHRGQPRRRRRRCKRTRRRRKGTVRRRRPPKQPDQEQNAIMNLGRNIYDNPPPRKRRAARRLLSNNGILF